MDSILSIVIPVYNEQEALPVVLPEIIEYCKSRNWQLILVNDGSKDNSKDILLKFNMEENVMILHHKLNKGYGGAIKTGIKAVQTKYLITIDADGQHVLSDIDDMLAIMIEKDADLMVGSRPMIKSNIYRNIGKYTIRSIAKFLMPVHIKDINSGMKLYLTELAKKYITICPNTMAFSDIMTLSFISQRHLVLEHPISIRQRKAGKSTIGTRTAIETVLEIINIVVLFNPMKIFFPTALLFMIPGLYLAIPVIINRRIVGAGAAFLVTFGLIFFFLGLMTEQLALIRKGKINE